MRQLREAYAWTSARDGWAREKRPSVTSARRNDATIQVRRLLAQTELVFQQPRAPPVVPLLVWRLTQRTPHIQQHLMRSRVLSARHRSAFTSMFAAQHSLHSMARRCVTPERRQLARDAATSCVVRLRPNPARTRHIISRTTNGRTCLRSQRSRRTKTRRTRRSA
jgi:hypothetical protein